jgi:RNA recognition motif-containing protein
VIDKTSNMFALRRVAVRALQSQPTRQLSSLRPVSLTSLLETSKPALYRSFHQSCQWQNQNGEPVTSEPGVEEQKEIKEESIATGDVTDGAPSAMEQVKNAMAGAAESFSGSAARQTGQSFPLESSDKILYVGNLFFEVTTPEMEAEFGRYGEIVNCRIVRDAQGLSKGFGYVEYTNSEDAKTAIRELDQKVFQGRRLAVQEHVRREKVDRIGRPDPRMRGPSAPSKTLFIGNLSYQMSDRDLNGEYYYSCRCLFTRRVADY